MAAPWMAREEGYGMLLGRRLLIALVLTTLLASPAHALDLEAPTAGSFWTQVVEWISNLWGGETSVSAEPNEPTTVPQDEACLDGCDRGMGVDPNG